jgi:hypothetical protein
MSNVNRFEKLTDANDDDEIEDMEAPGSQVIDQKRSSSPEQVSLTTFSDFDFGTVPSSIHDPQCNNPSTRSTSRTGRGGGCLSHRPAILLPPL